MSFCPYFLKIWKHSDIFFIANMLVYFFELRNVIFCHFERRGERNPLNNINCNNNVEGTPLSSTRDRNDTKVCIS